MQTNNRSQEVVHKMAESFKTEELLFMMKRINLSLTAQMELSLGNKEITGVQVYFLVYILRHHPDGTYLTELCREIGVSKPTLSALIKTGTILDNLRWGNPDATEEECIEACKAACADEFIDRMPDGYHTNIARGGANVSGGQKQRLCIARALLKKPKVLILDDSTSAVDTATDASIRAAFAKEIPGTTKIIIAQRISSVQSADRILVLDNGRIDAFDTHDNLLKTNAIYQEIYHSQMEGGGDFDQPA